MAQKYNYSKKNIAILCENKDIFDELAANIYRYEEVIIYLSAGLLVGKTGIQEKNR